MKSPEIVFFPCERIQNRYTCQWWDWFEEGFERSGISYVTIGNAIEQTCPESQFYDVLGGTQYRLKQIEDFVARLMRRDMDAPFRTVFFMDLWNPMLPIFAYLRNALEMDFKIKGCIHDGTWDPWDYTTRNGMKSWGRHFERSMIEFVDEIFCATRYHRDMIQQYFNESFPMKIKIVDWPVLHPETVKSERKDVVLFPHSFTDSKGLDEYLMIKEMFKEQYPSLNVEWRDTLTDCNSKQDYYDEMDNAKVVLSTALQETFGIAIAEGVVRGCVPIVPDRLSYQEIIEPQYRFKYPREAVDMIHKAIVNYKRPIYKGFAKGFNWIDMI
jgi:hypothetical protein